MDWVVRMSLPYMAYYNVERRAPSNGGEQVSSPKMECKAENKGQRLAHPVRACGEVDILEAIDKQHPENCARQVFPKVADEGWGGSL